MNITNLPAPRVKFIDDKTGVMSREWYRFFLNLFQLVGNGNNSISLSDIQLEPKTQDSSNIIDNLTQQYALGNFDQSGMIDYIYQQSQLASMIARLEQLLINTSQLDNLVPPSQLGTLASQNSDNVLITGGVIAATSFNKITITTPATSATFTLIDGKTFTVNNTLSLVGTDLTTLTFPTTSATIARTDSAQTFTGVQTLSSNPIIDAGTANGVAYLNGSKSLTSGTALTFSGTYLGIGVASPTSTLHLAYSASSLYSGTGVITDTGNYTGIKLYDSGAGNLYIFNKRNSAAFGNILFMTGATPNERLRITNDGNIHGIAGTTGMTNGFIYIPSAAGVPTGTPTSISGTVPLYYDSTNNDLYVYNTAWKK